MKSLRIMYRGVKYYYLAPMQKYLRNFINQLVGKPQVSGVIFMLHRVENKDPNGLYPNENLKLSPDKLDTILQQLKKKFQPIKLEEVPEYISRESKKPFMVFTMDDGYRDNLTKALPVFKKHKVPYTIFLATDFPDSKALMWWYELEQLIIDHEQITLGNGMVFNCSSYHEKNKVFLKIRQEILKIEQTHLKEGLDFLFSKYNINWSDKCSKLSLSWEECKYLLNEPIVSLGAHTMHHYNLRALPTSGDVLYEISSGCQRMLDKIGFKPTTFAYPYGTENEASNREFSVLATMKDQICLAVRANGGVIIKNKNFSMYSLPRVLLSDNFRFSELLGKDYYI